MHIVKTQNIISHQENANQNCNEILFTSTRMVIINMTENNMHWQG